MTEPSTVIESSAHRLAKLLRNGGDEGELVKQLEAYAAEITAAASTGVYSDIEVARAIRDGQIVIHPLIPDHIKGSSVDVTLGEWFYKTSDDIQQFDPFDEEDIEEYFGEPLRAMPNAAAAKKFKVRPSKAVGDDHLVIPIKPAERLLCHTNEFIGIKPPGTSMMKARSSSGRIGIAACFCAGWGDPGYINRWTMEVYNLNKRAIVLLPVNMRLAQLILLRTGACLSNYGTEGKYQAGTDVAELAKGWDPTAMLPRMFKDSVIDLMPDTIPSYDETISMLAPFLQAA